jgi:hypothetical protein
VFASGRKGPNKSGSKFRLRTIDPEVAEKSSEDVVIFKMVQYKVYPEKIFVPLAVKVRVEPSSNEVGGSPAVEYFNEKFEF